MLGLFLVVLTESRISPLILRSGRVINPAGISHATEARAPGWFFVHFANFSVITTISETLRIAIDTTSFVNNNWLCLFVNARELRALKSRGFLVEPVDPVVGLSGPIQLDSDNGYLIEVHRSFNNVRNYSRMYDSFYFADEFPDLSDPSILSVTPIEGPELLNRWAPGMVQAENARIKTMGGRLVTDRPIHERGIRGDGVLITVLDSGIDTTLCQFADPKRAIPFDRYDPNHRKIVRYDAMADRGDSKNGHGTHVAGILAGNAGCSNCSIGLYDGHAPNAKLHFVDAGLIRDPSLLIPDLKINKVLGTLKSLGVKVWSNSWGFPPKGKDSYRLMFDRIAHENRDVSIFFGCGNDNEDGEIYTPSNSKNVFSVGGTSKVELVNEKYFVTAGGREIPVTRYNWSGLPVLDSEYFIGNGSVYVVNGGCKALQSLPNDTVAVFTSLSDDLICRRSKFCVFSLNATDLEDVRKAARVSIRVDAALSDSWHVAAFNSAGPSNQGIIKPDIMAPGSSIISTRSDSKVKRVCTPDHVLYTKSGTSMAVPVVSASAAMIIQYFRDGHFPYKLSPSSMLVRAMLVNGAIPRNLPANVRSGFGMVRLVNSMAFVDSDFKMLVADEQSVSQTEQLIADIRVVGNNGNLTVTMTYSDPPMNVESDIPLYADLDLLLIHPDGRLTYVNECRQTTERIHIANATSGVYRVVIVCHEYFVDVDIPVAVVATGRFDESGFLEFKREYFEKRKCQHNETGYNCEVSMMEIRQQNKFKLAARQASVFWVTVPEMSSSEKLCITIDVRFCRRCLLQTELSVVNVAKFGGTMLDWNVIEKSHSFIIGREFATGTRLYLSVFEASDHDRDLNIKVTLVNGTHSLRDVHFPAMESMAPTRAVRPSHSAQQSLESLKPVMRHTFGPVVANLFMVPGVICRYDTSYWWFIVPFGLLGTLMSVCCLWCSGFWEKSPKPRHIPRTVIHKYPFEPIDRLSNHNLDVDIA